MSSEQTTIKMAQLYLTDERTALSAWYRDYRTQETGIPGTEISLPRLEKIEETFQEWLERSRVYLFELICVEWNYPAKRKEKEFAEMVSFVVALGNFLIAQTIKIPSPLALAALLAMRGLDMFCNDNET